MATSESDQFVNMAYASVAESAAGTLTFSELNTGIAIFEKVAWIVHRIDWIIMPAYQNLILAEADSISFALCCSNSLSSLTPSRVAVIDYGYIGLDLFGTPANAYMFHVPIIHDFSTLPGGGIIVPPNPLYVAIQGASLASVVLGACRIFFTIKTLEAEEYWELVQARQLVG